MTKPLGKSVMVQCGEKPLNASTNCDPGSSPCLYHIPSDPCEYNNIASDHPDKVKALVKRFNEYRETMVPAGNKPFDPHGNPINNAGKWIPWM